MHHMRKGLCVVTRITAGAITVRYCSSSRGVGAMPSSIARKVELRMTNCGRSDLEQVIQIALVMFGTPLPVTLQLKAQ